ncbi:MAG: DUF1292 domain-containing protein [Clostridia bacterium]|nr:DUF1292 domain-containing protein [Clostridia bacterium]
MEDLEKNGCGCGCGHDHEHKHSDDCGCGHDHEHGDDCGCGHEHQYMTLQLEDDTEVRCIVIGTFEIEEYPDKEYIALVSEDGEESFIYEYTEADNEDGFELSNIESDDEFEVVINAIDEILNSEEEWDEDDDYEFEEDDCE